MYPLQFIDHIRTCVLVIDPPNFIYSSLQRRFKAGYREDAVRCGGIRNRLLIPRCRSLFRHRLVKYQAKTRWRGSVCIFEILCLSAIYLGIRLEEWIKLHRHLFRHPTIQASVIRNPMLVLHT